VVLLDLHMPGGDDISNFANGSRVLAMSLADDEATQNLAASCGAATLLNKSNLGTELVPAIKDLAAA
jgi:DNA-binding NarL/FixJ family response regulator